MEIWPILLLITYSQVQAYIPSNFKNPDDFGSSVAFQKQDITGQHDFGYSEVHASGATFRRESGDAFGNKIGAYGLKDADGRLRVVNYVADGNGFKATITTNEPGIVPQAPASVIINKPSIIPLPAPAIPVAPPAPPVSPVAIPPPPVPFPAPIAVPQKVFPPPAVSYNYFSPAPAPLAIRSPPPPYYFPPVRPVGSSIAPLAVGPVNKGAPVYPPPPPLPPPAYYTNLIPGNGYRIEENNILRSATVQKESFHPARSVSF